MPDDPKRPDLSAPTVDQLHEQADLTNVIYRAASIIDAAGFEVSIDMRPGVGPRIHVMPRVPMAGPEEQGLLAWRAYFEAAKDLPWREPNFSAAPSGKNIPAGQPVPTVAPSQPPAEGLDQTAEAPVAADQSAEDAAQAVAEGKGPEAVAATTNAPAAPSLPVAGGSDTPSSKSGGFMLARPWAEEEDARLVDLMVAGINSDMMTVRAAAFQAADHLGRPREGVYFRVNSKLKSRIEEALKSRIEEAVKAREAVQAGAAGPGQADTAKAAPAVLVVAEGPETQAAAETQLQQVVDTILAAASDPLTVHLLALKPARDGWQIEDDAEILKLAMNGWKAFEIALEMQIGDRELRARFDLLTGYDADTKARRWSRTDVLGRLEALIARAA